MDELEKRRQKLAAPIDEIKDITAEDFNKLSANDIDNMKSNYQFEKQLESAFAVDVPDNLENKILLKQTTQKNTNLFFMFRERPLIQWHLGLRQ